MVSIEELVVGIRQMRPTKQTMLPPAKEIQFKRIRQELDMKEEEEPHWKRAKTQKHWKKEEQWKSWKDHGDWRGYSWRGREDWHSWQDQAGRDWEDQPGKP